MLLRRSGRWLVSVEGREYPARQARVDELLDLLTRRDSYPRRSNSPSSQGLFGLSEAQASRIILRGGAGLPLLDLLIGSTGAGGSDLYLRKANGSEVRSGGGDLITYIDGEARSWYNLRLFPEAEEGGITADLVQRLSLFPPAKNPEAGGTSPEAGGTSLEAGGTSPAAEGAMPGVVITREQNSWRISGGDLSLGPDTLERSRVDSYIGGILSTAGDDIVPAPAFPEEARLSLELGDGRVLTLTFGPPEGGRRPVSRGGPYGYVLGSWALDRIFRGPEYFMK
jgi:hypothetical protein